MIKEIKHFVIIKKNKCPLITYAIIKRQSAQQKNKNYFTGLANGICNKNN